MKRSLVLLCLMLPMLAFAQTFRFNRYTTEDGISQNFIYSIDQDEMGYLWVGTGEGLCRFDGKNFTTYTTKDGLAEDIITCSYVDESTGAIWYGHNEGSLSQMNDGTLWAFIPDEETIESTINGICGNEEFLYFIAQNEGVYEISEGEEMHLGAFGGEGFYAIHQLDKENLIVGTTNGLRHIAWTGGGWELEAEYITDKWVSTITKCKGDEGFLLGLQSGGLMRATYANGKFEFKEFELGEEVQNLTVKTILQDGDGSLWIGSYGSGLVKIHADSTGNINGDKTEYNTSTGMSSDFVQTVFQDREGNIWVGTFGAGLSTLIDDFFTFYTDDTKEFGNDISAIWIDENDNWYGAQDGLIRVRSNGKIQFYNDTTGLFTERVTALCLRDSIMWIGTNYNGMYELDIRTEDVRKVEWEYGSLENSVNQIIQYGKYIMVATEGGIIFYDPSSGTTTLLNTSSGLAHNAINAVLLGQDDNVWMGTHSRYLYKITETEVQEFEISNGSEIEVVSIAQGDNGIVWIATAEAGVYRLQDSIFVNYSSQDGLKSNYCYAIQPDANGNIWVGHRGGLSKIVPQTGQITAYDHKSGIKDQVNSNAMFLDNSSYLWIGTDGGVIRYDPSKDKTSEVSPVINLLTVFIGDVEYPTSKKIDLPYGNYRIQFEYVGVSFSDPDLVTYQFQLEGHDEIYSDFTAAHSATYGKISEGEYVFKVIACNENGVCSPLPARLEIHIEDPIWKKWWFYLLIFLSIIGIFVMLVRIRLKRLRANQLYLQKQLTIKTKEVVDKAQRIEEINKDLTDSINYAERIQNSILPDQKILNEALPGSFIFYKPRDIVSGDFYFLQRIENKLIVACVDCTGHGVPGGFMSMIGAVTLRNIYSKSKWERRTPEKVLEELDKEVELILQQKGNENMTLEEQYFQSSDGMDLTLCEIDLETNEVLLAGAMRTSFIQQNGKLEIVRGDKRAIGGGQLRRVDFTLQRFQMNPGDALYLFTDGYPDQFGGKNGGKLKSIGTRDIVEGLKDLDRDQYYNRIASSFENWQGDWKQIDDVLFVGLLF